MHLASITADWTQSVQARRILRSFRANPPQVIEIPHNQRWDNHTVMHGGYRVECLRRLWNEYGEKLLADYDRTDDYAPVAAFLHGQPSVEEAIDWVMAA